MSPSLSSEEEVPEKPQEGDFEPITLANGMKMQLPQDQVAALEGNLFDPQSNQRGEVFNPILKNAMNDAAFQTVKSLSSAGKFEMRWK